MNSSSLCLFLIHWKKVRNQRNPNLLASGQLNDTDDEVVENDKWKKCHFINQDKKPTPNVFL